MRNNKVSGLKSQVSSHEVKDLSVALVSYEVLLNAT